MFYITFWWRRRQRKTFSAKYVYFPWVTVDVRKKSFKYWSYWNESREKFSCSKEESLVRLFESSFAGWMPVLFFISSSKPLFFIKFKWIQSIELNDHHLKKLLIFNDLHQSVELTKTSSKTQDMKRKENIWKFVAYSFYIRSQKKS